MRVLVTGGSGHLGRATVSDLLDRGYEVISADQRPAAGEVSGHCRYVETDLGDVGQVAGAMSGCDAVIHLGAIPNPYRHADEVVFNNNVRATFATLQAASLLGVRKAVIASSISALGSAWAPLPFPPLYAPVDEAHPLVVKDCYGLSKEVDERTAEMFHRRTGMQVIALRFHWVAKIEDAKELAKIISADPRHRDWWKQFWGYVDLRDAAMICRLGIEVDGLGFEPFLVTAADTLSTTPTEELLRSENPTVEIRSPIEGTSTAFSIDKARRMLGYEPKHSWRD